MSGEAPKSHAAAPPAGFSFMPFPSPHPGAGFPGSFNEQPGSGNYPYGPFFIAPGIGYPGESGMPNGMSGQPMMMPMGYFPQNMGNGNSGPQVYPQMMFAWNGSQVCSP